MKGRWNQLRWGSAQAGVSLSLASTAWLLSGLTPSPLLNTLLPALTTLPALLPLRRRPGAFCWIVISALALLLLCSPLGAGVQTAWAIPLVLCAGLVIALGQDFSQLPLQRKLLQTPDLTFQQLRRGSELGALLGFGLTGLIRPGWHQFLPAAVLLLPLLPSALQRQPNAVQAMELPGFNREAAWQGLVFGAFFGLLPLWIRSIAEGNCFNFGMVLAAYGIGRSLITASGRRSSWSLFGPIGGLLMAIQLLPGFISTLLFIPLGGLAAATDRQLVDRLHPTDPAEGWQVLRRSGAIGGLVGVLAMGSLAQVIGLPQALLVQVGLFLTAPLLLKALR